MAAQEEVDELRRKADLTSLDNTFGDDVALASLIDAEGSVDLAAAALWELKASSYSKLVNVSESGSSRSMGDLFKNALAMSKFYSDRDAEETIITAGPVARTRAVVREGGF